jgi:hypothetical protein
MTRFAMSFFGFAFGTVALVGALWGTRDAGANVLADHTPHTLSANCCHRQ